jgi:putative ATP-dependent endonuclease of the OLD family
MKLTSLKVLNFKGLRDVTIPLSNFVCLTGHNNAGKSSLLQALLCFIDGKKLSKTHYYSADADVVITACFDSINDDDLALIVNEEHRERIRTSLTYGSLTFVRRYSTEGTSRLRWLAFVPSDPRFSDESLDTLLRGKKASAGLAAEVVAAFPELAGKVEAKTNLTQIRTLVEELAQSQPPENKTPVERDLPTGIDASVKPFLPEPIYIPAVKDLADDIKTKDGTSFGRLLGMLLNALTSQLAPATEAFAVLNATLNVLKNPDGTISDERHDAVKLVESTVQRYVREHFPMVSVEITIPPPEIKTILSSAHIFVDDGVKGELESKGDGLKRSVTFSILRSYAELKRHPTLGGSRKEGAGFLLLFEEPELYLHPSAQRVLFDALRVISQSDQVLVSTHSPLFFSAECTGTFVKIEKRSDPNSGEKPYGHAVPIDLCTLDRKSQFHVISYESSNTAFFSNKVVLVEGDSDFLVFPHLARTLNTEWCVNKAGVALCRLNGKGSIRVYKEFFQAFDVRVVVLADLDCILDEFKTFDVSEECKRAREKLLVAVDREITTLNDTMLSMGKIKRAAASADMRELWNKMQAIYQKSLKNEAAGEELKLAGDAFFLDETKASRRVILEDDTITEVRKLKEEVLLTLRKSDVFLLSRGTLEKYYPSGITGKDKPTRALNFCDTIKTRGQALALCDRVLAKENGDKDYEFDLVFGGIFGASPVAQLAAAEAREFVDAGA